MGIRGGTLPGTRRVVIRSYVAEYVERNELDADFEELASVEVDAIAPVRTLAEKLALLHHSATSAVRGTTNQLLRSGRHIYDVARLLSDDGVLADLRTDGSRMAELAADVDQKSAEYGWEFTPRPEGGYAASAVFESQGPLHSFTEQAYSDAELLMWGDVPTLDDCLATVKRQAELL